MITNRGHHFRYVGQNCESNNQFTGKVPPCVSDREHLFGVERGRHHTCIEHASALIPAHARAM